MTKSTVPTWFKVVSILALLWNIMGLGAFLFDTQQTPESMQEMGLDPAMIDAYLNSPTWNWIAYGVATIFGFLGSLLLVLKRRQAVVVLLISLVGVVIQFYYGMFMTDMYQQMGGTAYIMPIMVLIIAFYLYFLARRADKANWLR